MATLSRVTTQWTNWAGGPGATTMYLSGAPDGTDLGNLRDFWDAIKAFIPTGINLQVISAGDNIEDSTGDLVGLWSATGPATVIGTGAGAYASPTGAYVRWNTSTIAHSHLLFGRTFIVPIAASQYENNGTLAGTFTASLATAAQTLLTSVFGTKMVIWSRPVKNAAGAVTRAGSNGAVTTRVVPDKVAVLRSRRD